MKKKIVCLLAITVVCWSASSVFAASHSDNGCYTCHVPHNAASPTTNWGVPLWNPATTSAGTTFTLYSSPTFNANLAAGGSAITQPNGPSQLCLGCHDGSFTGSMNGVTLASVPAFNFGSDLSKTHPISFAYTPALAANTKIVGELNNPVTTSSTLGGTIDTDLLDQNHNVQCTSCHDVHTSAINQTYTDNAGNTFNPLLRFAWSPTGSGSSADATMCQICHNK